MAIAATTQMTVEEYLAFERESEERHEWIDGEVVAMGGASRPHDRIKLNLHRKLLAPLDDHESCEPYSNDIRVRVSDSGLYTYPDFTVACGEPAFEDDVLDTLLNPTLIVEILSPSTANYDRGEKWVRYRSIPSLREYLLIAQDQVRVERFVRHEAGHWLFYETRDLDAKVHLESVGLDLSVADLYRKVELAG